MMRFMARLMGSSTGKLKRDSTLYEWHFISFLCFWTSIYKMPIFAVLARLIKCRQAIVPANTLATWRRLHYFRHFHTSCLAHRHGLSRNFEPPIDSARYPYPHAIDIASFALLTAFAYDASSKRIIFAQRAASRVLLSVFLKSARASRHDFTHASLFLMTIYYGNIITWYTISLIIIAWFLRIFFAWFTHITPLLRMSALPPFLPFSFFKHFRSASFQIAWRDMGMMMPTCAIFTIFI